MLVHHFLIVEYTNAELLKMLDESKTEKDDSCTITESRSLKSERSKSSSKVSPRLKSEASAR